MGFNYKSYPHCATDARTIALQKMRQRPSPADELIESKVSDAN